MAILWDNVSWAATTAYSLNARVLHNVDSAWIAATPYDVGAVVANLGGSYQCTVAGTSAGSGGPSGVGSAIVDGGVTWKFLQAEQQAVYLCVYAGTSGSTGPSGTAAVIVDGSAAWKYLGLYLGQYVLGCAPELAAGAHPVLPSAQVMFLQLAEEQVSDPCIFQPPLLMDACRAYLAAAFGQAQQLRSRGPITSESVGPLSRGYGNLVGPYGWQLTLAGRMYHDLLATTPASLGWVS